MAKKIIPDYVYERLRIAFITGDMTLRDLSSEETGNSDLPTYGTIRARSGKDNPTWGECRKLYQQWKDHGNPRDVPECVRSIIFPGWDGSPFKALPSAEEIPDRQERYVEIAQNIDIPEYLRYLDVLPERMQQDYSAFSSDPTLLQLREELALITARIKDLGKRVNKGESGKTWSDLHSKWKEFNKAKRTGDSDVMATCLMEVGTLIGQGHQDYLAWDEIGKWMDRRKHFVESEQKRMALLERSIPVDRATRILAAVLQAIKEEFADQPDRLSHSWQRIQNILHSEDFYGLRQR